MIKVAILGGGVWVPRALSQLARAWPEGPLLQVYLLARRAERLAVVAGHARRRLAALRPDWQVEHTTDRARALDGAAAVVLLVRVGGLAARAHDEAFPAAFGLAGDEGLGPGGLANAWRTVPWLDRLAPEIAARAPGAAVLNMMAPLGIATQALGDHGLDVTGICELPAVTRAELGGVGGHYAGLNHLGLFWGVRGRPGLHPLKYVERVFGDERPALGRAQALARLSDVLVDAFAATDHPPGAEGERPTPWFEQALCPALVACLGGPRWLGYANRPNPGLMRELPRGHVVELAADWGPAGPALVDPGPLPALAVPFLQAVGRSEALGLQAARARDPARLRQALAALPLTLPTQALDGLTAAAIQEVGA